MIWASMGNHSKSLGFPGFTPLWQVKDKDHLEQNRIEFWAGRNLARHCGQKMFVFSFLSGRDVYARFGRKGARRPISRVLSRPLSGPWMTIPLGRPLPDASRDLPGRLRRKRRLPAPVSSGRPAGHPYAVLLPVGFALPPPLPAARCALTAPFHPCRRGTGLRWRRGRRSALCGTFPGVAPAGHYPAPCFRGARTFLEPAVADEAAVIQPSGEGTSREAGWGSQPGGRWPSPLSSSSNARNGGRRPNLHRHSRAAGRGQPATQTSTSSSGLTRGSIRHAAYSVFGVRFYFPSHPGLPKGGLGGSTLATAMVYPCVPRKRREGPAP